MSYDLIHCLNKYYLINAHLIELTRMPLGPNSRAKHLVNMSNALFAIQ